MTRTIAIGIDLGTSGMRLAALDGEGGVETSQVAIAGRRDDPAAWWTALETLLDRLSGADVAVRGIAIDGTSGTLLACAPDGAAIGPAILYNDPVDDPALVTRIDRSAPAGSIARGPNAGLARAIRLAGRAGASRVLHEADWLAGRLTGRFDATDENNALKTGYDPVARAWPAWIERAGMPVQALPRVWPVGAPLGAVQDSLAERWPMLRGAVLRAGTTDGCAAFLASGASEVGDAVTSLGSTIVLKVLSDGPVFAPSYGLYSHRIGHRWLVGGASNTGGAVLAGRFTPDRLDILSRRIDPDRPTGIACYPLPRPGERFPINDPDLAPRMPETGDATTDLQALLEGMAEIERQGYARIAELGGPRPRSLRTVGGGARNAAWTRIRERALGLTSSPVLSRDAAFGAARIAAGAVP